MTAIEIVDQYGHRPLPVYTPSDPDKARAAVMAKAARERVFWDNTRAAKESQTVQALRKAAREATPKPAKPKPKSGGYRPDAVRLCRGTCGRMTRPKHAKAEEFEGTVQRVLNGYCKGCSTPAVSIARKCEGTCGRMTRPTSRKASDFEFPTVPRFRKGCCAKCCREKGWIK